MANLYQSEQEIVAVVSGFETCTTGKEGFTHLSHLTVGAYYLLRATPEEAFQKIRDGLLRFLDHHGIDRSKYRDDLTHAWIKEIQIVLEQTTTSSSPVEVINTVIERLREYRLPVDPK